MAVGQTGRVFCINCDVDLESIPHRCICWRQMRLYKVYVRVEYMTTQTVWTVPEEAG